MVNSCVSHAVIVLRPALWRGHLLVLILVITGSGRQVARWAPFTGVNTALGNIKTALAGTYRHISAKHAQRYLASFAWRFNRRYVLDTATERLAWPCIHAKPQPYHAIIAG